MLLYVDGVRVAGKSVMLTYPVNTGREFVVFVQGVVKIPGGGVNSTMLSKNIIPVTTPKELRKL